ncbi:MAG: PPE domain-containing protein [Pseudonocardiaceae bacterium]
MAGPIDIVTDLLGLGGPSGTDGGSSNWAAWGHAEIRSMLDTSVDPSDISDAASAWRDLGRHATDIVTGLTRDLNGTVSGGWRGAGADAAVAALAPLDQWSASVADAADHTTALMDASGSSAGQAKATVPPAKEHDWGQSLRSFALGGPAAAVIDAVAQDRAQSEAHTEAVQIMNNVYSAPINDHRVAVPAYPQLVDPTLQPPEQHPSTWPAPALGQPGQGIPGGGSSAQAAGYLPHSQTLYSQPTPAGLQSATGGGHAGLSGHSGGPVAPDPAGPRQPAGGQVAAAAAGLPVMPGTTRSGDIRRPGRTGGVVARGGRTAGGHASGAGRSGGGLAGAGVSRATEFGPRPSIAAAPAADSRTVAGLGRGASGVPGARSGDLISPIGGGRGNGGEDTERRRPSYLIEMDDIFTDGRKVAPPVIGEDSPDREG